MNRSMAAKFAKAKKEAQRELRENQQHLMASRTNLMSSTRDYIKYKPYSCCR